MKRLAVLPTLVSALAVLALACASSAPAAVLCKSATEHCASSSVYGKGTVIEASLKSGTKWTLNAGYKTFECEEAAIRGEVTSPGGPTTSVVSGPVTTFSVGKCNGTVEVPKNGTFKIAYSSAGSGTLTLEGIELTTLSGSFCAYGGPVSMSLTGGAMASLKAGASSVPLKEGFPSCAKPATLTAEYTVTKPEPLYVEREKTAAVFCKTATFLCSSAYGLGTKVTFGLVSGTLFTFGSPTYEGCAEVALEGEVTAEPGKGTDVSGPITKFTFGSCTHEVKVLKRGTFRVVYVSGTTSGLILEGFEVSTALCNFTGPANMTLSGGEKATLSISALVGGTCTGGTWEGALISSAPVPLYVSEL